MDKERILERLGQVIKELGDLQTELEKEDTEVNVDEVEEKANKLIEEKRSLEEKLNLFEQEKARRDTLYNDIIEGRKGKVIKEFTPEEKGDRDMERNEEQLYRNAFLKNLLGEKLTEEETRAFTHTTSNTEQVLPKDLENKIYSNMEESHPILADIQYLRSGTVITIVKHTKITSGDAKIVNEGEANDDEQNTFVNVTLSGKDFSKHIDISYRLNKMSIPAFETYLAKEISDRLSSAVAKEVIAQIKKDLNTSNKITTKAKLSLDDITNAFGELKGVTKTRVYANNKTLFGSIVSLPGEKGRQAFIPDYANGINGRLLGSEIKLEDALGDKEILILDGNQFIFNEVQPLLIERDKDIKKHVHTISGIIIGEGTMTNDKAGALITVAEGV